MHVQHIPAVVALEQFTANLELPIDPHVRFVAMMPPVLSSSYPKKESYIRNCMILEVL
ncbi:MAG: hypothetical protein H6908_05500 [Hyphomicrobiales bacterium]|nr:hypothetical protein [Hyphomicrobiales bacterium]